MSWPLAFGQRPPGGERQIHRELVGPSTYAQQGDVDDGRLASGRPAVQRRRDASGDRHPTDRVAIGPRRHPAESVGARRRHSRRTAATRPERGAVVTAFVGLGTSCPETATAHVDYLRVDRTDRVEIQAELGSRPGQIVGEKHITAANQLLEHRPGRRIVQRQADTAFSAVRALHDRKERVAVHVVAEKGDDAALSIAAFGMLDLDDLSTPVGQDRSCRGHERVLRDLEDPHACHRSRHRLALLTN